MSLLESGYEGQSRERGARGCPLARRQNRYFTSRTILRSLTACGPSSAASWSCTGPAAFMKPVLSTPSTTFTPIDFSLSAESFSSLSASAGSRLLTSVAAACTQPCCSGVRLFHVLSLTQMQLLLASCSV